jgi:hypothetical protein
MCRSSFFGCKYEPLPWGKGEKGLAESPDVGLVVVLDGNNLFQLHKYSLPGTTIGFRGEDGPRCGGITAVEAGRRRRARVERGDQSCDQPNDGITPS